MTTATAGKKSADKTIATSQVSAASEKNQLLRDEDEYLSYLASFAKKHHSSIIGKKKDLLSAVSSSPSSIKSRSRAPSASYSVEKIQILYERIRKQEQDSSIRDFVSVLRQISSAHEDLFQDLENTIWADCPKVFQRYIGYFTLYPFMFYKASLTIDDTESLGELLSRSLRRFKEYIDALGRLLAARKEVEKSSVQLSTCMDRLEEIRNMFNKPVNELCTMFNQPDDPSIEGAFVLRMMERSPQRTLLRCANLLEIVCDDDSSCDNIADATTVANTVHRWYLFNDTLTETCFVPKGMSLLRQFDLSCLTIVPEDTGTAFPNCLRLYDPLEEYSVRLVFPCKESAEEWAEELKLCVSAVEQEKVVEGVDRTSSGLVVRGRKESEVAESKVKHLVKSDQEILRVLGKRLGMGGRNSLEKPGRRLVHQGKYSVISENGEVDVFTFFVLTDILLKCKDKATRLKLKRVYPLDDAKIQLDQEKDGDGFSLQIQRKNRVIHFVQGETTGSTTALHEIISQTLTALAEIRRVQRRSSLEQLIRLQSKTSKYFDRLSQCFVYRILAKDYSFVLNSRVIYSALQGIAQMKELHSNLLQRLREDFFLSRETQYRKSNVGEIFLEYAGLWTLYIHLTMLFERALGGLEAAAISDREVRKSLSSAAKHLLSLRSGGRGKLFQVQGKVLGYLFRYQTMVLGVQCRDERNGAAAELFQRIHAALDQVRELVNDGQAVQQAKVLYEKTSGVGKRRLVRGGLALHVVEMDKGVFCGLPAHELNLYDSCLELISVSSEECVSVFSQVFHHLYVCELENTSSLVNGFRVVVRNKASAKSFRFSAPCPKEQMEWLNALRQLLPVSPETPLLNLTELQCKLRHDRVLTNDTRVLLLSASLQLFLVDTRLKLSDGVAVLCSDILFVFRDTSFGYVPVLCVPLVSCRGVHVSVLRRDQVLQITAAVVGDDSDESAGVEKYLLTFFDSLECEHWSQELLSVLESASSDDEELNLDASMDVDQRFGIPLEFKSMLPDCFVGISDVAESREVFVPTGMEDEQDEKALSCRSIDLYELEDELPDYLEQIPSDDEDLERFPSIEITIDPEETQPPPQTPDPFVQEMKTSLVKREQSASETGSDTEDDASVHIVNRYIPQHGPRKLVQKQAPGHGVDIKRLINFFSSAFEEEEEEVGGQSVVPPPSSKRVKD